MEPVQDFDEDENIGDETLECLIIISNKSDVLNGMTKRHFGKQMSKDTKLGIYNIISEVALRNANGLGIMDGNDRKQLGEAQMHFLKQLVGLTKQDKKEMLTLGTN